MFSKDYPEGPIDEHSLAEYDKYALIKECAKDNMVDAFFRSFDVYMAQRGLD